MQPIIIGAVVADTDDAQYHNFYTNPQNCRKRIIYLWKYGVIKALNWMANNVKKNCGVRIRVLI